MPSNDRIRGRVSSVRGGALANYRVTAAASYTVLMTEGPGPGRGNQTHVSKRTATTFIGETRTSANGQFNIPFDWEAIQRRYEPDQVLSPRVTISVFDPVTDVRVFKSQLVSPSTNFDVRVTYADALPDQFRNAWQSIGGEQSALGAPIGNVVSVSQGQAVYFDGGSLYAGPDTGGTVVFSYLRLPKLGNPKMIDPRPSPQGSLRLPGAVSTIAPKGWSAQTFSELWSDRLYLQAVTAPGTTPGRIPTYRYQIRETPYSASQVYVIVDLMIDPSRTGSAPLTDRTLFDVVLVPPGGEPTVVAPHALYVKAGWDRFGLIHITDLHVSHSCQAFKERLQAAGLTEAVAAYNNPLDNFRDMIRYANHLHDIGLLDGVIATGDLVDYIFDEDGQDNFALLERLIRGQASTATSTNEPLRVPIFTVLGNHDYRPNRNDLCFSVNVAGYPLKNVDLYADFNLTESEALTAQGDTSRPGRSLSQALDMVRTDSVIGRGRGYSQKTYRRRFSDQVSYIVQLGEHRLVMLDTGEDLGIPPSANFETVVPLLLQYLAGGFSEDRLRAVAGAPNSEGFTPAHLQLVSQALREATGLVILGMHAPPFYPEGGEYGHYFRETEHPTIDPREVRAYLNRCADGGDTAEHEAEWVPTGTPYFKRGGIDLYLDAGIGRDRATDLLKLCVGAAGPGRPVDLLLTGHHHDNVEYRVGWQQTEQGGEFRFFTDFYSENPTRYYACRKAATTESVHEYVQAGAAVNGAIVRDHPGGETRYTIAIPPNPSTLQDAADSAAWWTAHRPLVVETASLGPLETYQRLTHPDVSFQGFRYLLVSGGVIRRMHNVGLAALRNQGYRMPWEQELRFPVLPHKAVTGVPAHT